MLPGKWTSKGDLSVNSHKNEMGPTPNTPKVFIAGSRRLSRLSPGVRRRIENWWQNHPERPQILNSNSASIPPRISMIPNTSFLPNPGKLQKNEPRAVFRSTPLTAAPAFPRLPEKPQILNSNTAEIPWLICLILNTDFLPNRNKSQNSNWRGGSRVTRTNRTWADQWIE
jgi:hypothetical protein